MFLEDEQHVSEQLDEEFTEELVTREQTRDAERALEQQIEQDNREAQEKLEEDSSFVAWKENIEVLSAELSKRAGTEVPLVVAEKFEQEHVDALRDDFNEAWESLGWDMYDVRRKQAEYAQRFDQELVDMDPLALRALVKKYYEGKDEDALKKMQTILARLKETPEHAEHLETITPDRKKAYSVFLVTRKENGELVYQKEEKQGAAQTVGEEDMRSAVREYADIPDNIIDSPAFAEYVKKQIYPALLENPSATQFKLEAWYMSTTARKGQPGDNSPEGYHQDGTQYIGNVVLRRDAEIEGGESVLYNRDPKTGKMTEINRTILEEGDQLSQRDGETNLWHDVTKFYVAEDAPGEGYRRDLLGSGVVVLDGEEKEEVVVELSAEQKKQLEVYKSIIAVADKYLVSSITVADPEYRKKAYLFARSQYMKAIELKNEFDLGDPNDFVKIVDHDGNKFVLITLEQGVSKIDEMYAHDTGDEISGRELDELLLEYDLEDDTSGNCPGV